jgi:Tn3 transposase DDE domain
MRRAPHSRSPASSCLRLEACEVRTALADCDVKAQCLASVQHPTYKALAELGKALKTIFLCRYLHSEALRREINEGLNIVEQWNGATDFVFFAKRGEFTSESSIELRQMNESSRHRKNDSSTKALAADWWLSSRSIAAVSS